MTHNYFVKCPTCGAVTRMRTPAGYIYRTPVRVHCGRCNTLLTGEFITDNKKITVKYIPSNCEEVIPQDCEYFGEAAGEMLCRKIEEFRATGKDVMMPPNGHCSPIFPFMFSTFGDEGTRFINYACYSSALADRWDHEQIKYDLFLSGQQSLLEQSYAKEMERLCCSVGTAEGLLQFGYRSFFYDLGGLFKKSELVPKLVSLNYRFSHMDKRRLKDYLVVLRESNRLDEVQRKLFHIMYDFWKVVYHLMPAIGLLYYNDLSEVDLSVMGMSTCSFEDIKDFYQNTYEMLVDCCDVIIGLDNLENRGDCNIFKNNFDLRKFREQSKGNRVNFLVESLKAPEYFTEMFNPPVASGSLRNAIGHMDYAYNGITQEISYRERTGSEVFLTTYLTEVALECCNMMRSAYILAFIVYELFRFEFRTGDEPMVMYPALYKGVKSQSRCPCGSGKKFRNCCRLLVNPHDTRESALDYPMKANFYFNPKQLGLSVEGLKGGRAKRD